ncbi:MAG: DUF5317 domain-containing protein [Armatimonadetes bacterium]|nr:DUF5317 domain-containing protein [Armatimonadota bacterium]
MVLEAAIVSIIVALIRRGNISRLVELLDRVERFWLVFVPAGLLVASVFSRRFLPDAVWMPLTAWLHVAAIVALLSFAFLNLRLPGLKWFFAGLLCNLLAAVANGGRMPVSAWAAQIAGAPDVYVGMRHLPAAEGTRLYFLSDIIPATRPPMLMPAALSVGDVLMAVGVFLLVQFTMCPGRRTYG